VRRGAGAAHGRADSAAQSSHIIISLCTPRRLNVEPASLMYTRGMAAIVRRQLAVDSS